MDGKISSKAVKGSLKECTKLRGIMNVVSWGNVHQDNSGEIT